MTPSILVRTRFPFDVLARLDTLAASIRTVVRRRVSRAALVRALVRLGMDTALAPELAAAIKADSVRRGREKGKPQGRRVAT